MKTSITVGKERGGPRRVGREAREGVGSAALELEFSMVRGNAFAYMD
jgi:hypothetical protein